MTPLFSHYINSGDTLVVGVSGGPDSTALLSLLVEFSQKTPCHIIVAHVNHGIRGKSADRDEMFVKKLAASYKLKFYSKRVKLAASQKTALEERGREVRRAFFESLARRFSARCIVTAHTEDDNLETIIFNFIRGSGIRGLAGMKVINGLYFKPLLYTEKKELLIYLRAKKQKFCVDATNADTHFSRNFIRKKILPLMRKLNPSLSQTILGNRKVFLELDEFLSQKAALLLKSENHFSLKEYEVLPEALQSALIQEMYARICGNSRKKGMYRLSAPKTAEIRRLLSKRIGGKVIECPGKIAFMLSKGLLKVSQN